MSKSVDINCDLGESFGQYSIGSDKEIMDFITSANIACGFHAGDYSTMKKTVALAAEKKVNIGAHPGLPDLQGFGRRNIALVKGEAYEITLYQLGALEAFVRAEGTKISHVKPHGALYNMAAADPQLAEEIVRAICDFDPSLMLFGLSGSELIKAGEKAGLSVKNEVFADRTYQDNGTLTPRTMEGSLIVEDSLAVKQVAEMVKHGTVTALSGNKIAIKADTVCIHGDGKHALLFAQKLNESLQKEGVKTAAAQSK
ncbi:5-oxoprolinase subunit PxpA [Fictibacillus aquaticus]|uniref:5-oxoprolinase subunit A n=1 Tax=Fictibacillus aquaticus TaxID=2021314 RepID=A0A235FEH1_9BACL|nr:5-oxoprolinase subunit PxpA [Fictibacillus aquaticus]OYD59612.1 lactam utilization protein LamB [Fictibacillus aquaticus]